MHDILLVTWTGPSSETPSFLNQMAWINNRLVKDVGHPCSYEVVPLKASGAYSWLAFSTEDGLSLEYLERLFKKLDHPDEWSKVKFRMLYRVSREVYDKIIAYVNSDTDEWRQLVLRKDAPLEKLIALATGQK